MVPTHRIGGRLDGFADPGAEESEFLIPNEFQVIEGRGTCRALPIGQERCTAVLVFLGVVPDRFPQWDIAARCAVGPRDVDKQVGGTSHQLLDGLRCEAEIVRGDVLNPVGMLDETAAERG
jgi:hypothetical protein